LVSHLVARELLSIDEAVDLLPGSPISPISSLSNEFASVIDALWLVREDRRDGVMAPTDDDTLRNALHRVVEYDQANGYAG
jgi:hypothetical protein